MIKQILICLTIVFLLMGCSEAASDSSPEYNANNLADLCNNEFDVSETERPATFTAKGEYAVMRGLIGSDTPNRVANLLDEHPDVKTIVIAYAPGSEDDESNLEASLMIHKAGLDTCVPPGGEINSGGVDLFLAGNERWLADDTWVGVHAWASDEYTATDIPKDDPEHQSYLDYYEAIGVNEDFYWYTLQAAPAKDIHNMSSAEREQYGMETD
ncbi:MAG: alpha/beta hydrolase [Candidatus Promineifilaceae bacterium]